MKDKIKSFVVVLNRFSISSLYRKANTSDFIRKVVGTFASKALLMSLTFITSVLVARILGPHDRGLYSVAVATTSMGVQFGTLGLNRSNVYYVAKNPTLLSPILGNSIIFSVLFGGFIASLTGLFFYLFPQLAPIHGILLLLTLTGIPLGLAYLFLRNILLGINQVFVYNIIELLNRFIYLIAVFFLMTFQGIIVETVYASTLLASFLCITFQIGHLWTKNNHPPQPSFQLLKDNVNYGIKAYLAALLFNMTLKTNLLMIQYFLGSEQAGYYSVADSLGNMIYTIPLMVGLLLFPKLSAEDSLHKSWVLVKKVTGIVSLITGGICLLVALLAKPLVLLIFGDAFLPAASVCAGLMPAVFFLGFQVIVMQFDAAIGFPISVVFVRLIGLVILVIYNLLFLRYGVQQAVIGSTISYACTAVLLLWIGRRKIREQVA